MIVVLNGPLGVGKTEVSWKLAALFERSVMLDGDYIGAVHPFILYDEGRVTYLYRTICHLVAFHQGHGYTNFVVNYVFETPETLGQLRRMLVELDDVTYAYRLTCEARALEARVRRRGEERLEWQLHRCRELSVLLEAAADRGDVGLPVDTTARTPEQVARAIWDDIHEEVRIAPYNADWPRRFAAEAAQIRAALGERALAIHHIGSTAVPGLPAKPIVDIMVAVRRLEDAIACIPPLRRLGYLFVDYPQNTDRRFFKKGKPRTHHLHIVEAGSDSLRRHLAFRDALRADPALCRAYAALKRDLANRFQTDRAAYTENKTAFIERALRGG